MSSKVASHPESPEISGLLYKKRGGFGKMMPNNWQYRLFILSKEGVLTYYDTEIPENKDIFESKERGRIDLKAVKFELTTEPAEGAPTQHTIVIHPEDGEKWKLCADTKEDHGRWWKAIEKFIQERSDRAANLAHLNIQSDDDEHNSPPGQRSARKPLRPTEMETPRGSVTSSSMNSMSAFSTDSTHGGRGIKPSAAGVAATTHAPASRTPTPPPAAPSAPATTAPVRKARGGLKLTKETSMISQDWMEWGLVMIIVNICVYGVVRTSATVLDRVIYIAALNLVVGHSLYLRTYRLTSSSNSNTNSTVSSGTDPASAAATAVPERRTSLPGAAQQRPSISIPSSSAQQGQGSGAMSVTTPVASAAAVAALEGEDPVAAGRALLRQGKKPIAGFTMQQVTTEPKLSAEHTWCKADYRQFNVRIGPDYNRNKKKAPSAAPIYEPFAVDVFCTKQRADHCSSRFQFVDPSSGAPINVDTHHPFVPPVFVIQIQIPSDPPSGFFTSAEDGPGWAILMYYRITEDAVNQLKDLSTASPAIKLFAEWCEKCTEDPLWRGRFKVINSCTNLDELGIPSAISAYNAKPIMIRRTGSITRGDNDGVRYMEMDIHVHKFATLAKQSIHYISSRCGQMYMQIGFVIEGVTDAELPETLFACVAVNKPQEELAEFIFEDDA